MVLTLYPCKSKNINKLLLEKPDEVHRKLFSVTKSITTIRALVYVTFVQYFHDRYFGKRRSACLDLFPRKPNRHFCRDNLMNLLTVGQQHNLTFVFYSISDTKEREQFQKSLIPRIIIPHVTYSDFTKHLSYFQSYLFYKSGYTSEQAMYCGAGSAIKQSFHS